MPSQFLLFGNYPTKRCLLAKTVFPYESHMNENRHKRTEKNYHFPFIYGLLRGARYNGGTRRPKNTVPNESTWIFRGKRIKNAHWEPSPMIKVARFNGGILRTNFILCHILIKMVLSYPDYAMKGGNPDRFRISAFSISLIHPRW